MSSRLTRNARDTIKWADVSIAGYIRHYSVNEEWRGDSCGCVDDRCVGYHHDVDEECGCLPVWIAEMRRDETRDRVLADVAYLRRACSTPLYPTGLGSFGTDDLEQLRDAFAATVTARKDAQQRWGWVDAHEANEEVDKESTSSALPRKSQ